MEIKQMVAEALEKVSGISCAELLEADDLDLIEEGILDSLSTVSLLSILEKQLSISIEIGRLSVKDFRSVNTIAEMIKNETQGDI